MPVYLIQGFFFQKQSWLGIGMSSEGEGNIAVIRSGLCQFMFSGIIYPDEYNALGGYAGQMNDHFGESKLFKVFLLLPEEVKFVKKYDRRDDYINYKFTKQNELWVGEYSGPEVGQGGAKCVITEVSEDLFRPPERI